MGNRKNTMLPLNKSVTVGRFDHNNEVYISRYVSSCDDCLYLYLLSLMQLFVATYDCYSLTIANCNLSVYLYLGLILYV